LERLSVCETGEGWRFGSAADWEVGDTADLEICATRRDGQCEIEGLDYLVMMY
jgi:hypothetical protein